jgi:hypothetical protein
MKLHAKPVCFLFTTHLAPTLWVVAKSSTYELLPDLLLLQERRECDRQTLHCLETIPYPFEQAILRFTVIKMCRVSMMTQFDIQRPY